MKLHKRNAVALVVMVAAALAVVSYAIAAGSNTFDETLDSYQEPPSISSVGSGTFSAELVGAGAPAIRYQLRYSGLEGNVAQAHIHLGQFSVNGGISVFLCTNLGNGPAGTQLCPPAPATITGTIVPANVIGPTGQGIAAGEFAELVRAMKAGVTYVNVHTDKFPGGEIRAQLGTG